MKENMLAFLSWSVTCFHYMKDGSKWYYKGNLYHYGLEPPHYPVPMLATQCPVCGVTFSCEGWDCLFSRVSRWCALTAYGNDAFN